MRKLLLATTALFGSVALSGAAHAMPAQTSPITLNVGGYVDFVAGFYDESQGQIADAASGSRSGSSLGVTALPGINSFSNRSFETEYKINFDAMGKAANGMQYGANVSLWNGPEAQNLWTGGGSQVEVNSAYVWMSGAFGKAMFGDSHGATDLFVYAPTVGEGQIDGRYTDFVSPFFVARFQPSGIDNTEHSTNITYYTPKVGNDDNKVQAGITYEPNMYDYGSGANLSGIPVSSSQNFNFAQGPASPYQDVVKGAAQYTGNFHPVNVALSGQIITGSGGNNVNGAAPYLYNFAPFSSGEASKFRDFTAWGVGTQVGFSGFTVGGGYTNMGSYGAQFGQNKEQDEFNLGGKYEFDKVALGLSWINGRGYDNLLLAGTGAPAAQTAASSTSTYNYVSNFSAYGAGAAYTWFPGLTSNLDGVMFQQHVLDQNDHNDGYVLMISQKMTF
jgi:outer membrane protein OmpU